MAEENKKHFSSQMLSFSDLVDLERWQKIQDDFSAVTNITLRTIDSKGLPITHPSGHSRLCMELLRKYPLRQGMCELCLPTFLGGRGIVDKNLSFECFAGLRSFIAPLRVNNNVLAYFLMGPVNLVMLRQKEFYRNYADELNLDIEDFWNTIYEIKVISFHTAQLLIGLVKEIGEYILDLAYRDKVREKYMIVSDPLKLSRFINALLDAAFHVSKADVGSIMLLDPEKEELTVQASKGLSEEVVKNAKVRLGEGVSGTVAKEGQTFIIDDANKDNRIKKYLKRPNLGSSMVIPIKIEDNVWGVISLAASRASSVKFTRAKVEMINKLIDLATAVYSY